MMKYANPYLPLWEHLPDGEARVFDDPDHPEKKRLYIIGSHDVRRDSYCGPDIRIWSAPTEDLTDWKDEGAVFTYQAPNGLWDIMFAPDLVEVKRRDGSKEYFLYPHSRGPGREAMVCSGPTPVGPFTPLNLDESGNKVLPGSFIGFDPSVYVEQIDDESDPDYDIGFRAYVYYGFQKSYAAQLDQRTMWSVRPGTEIIEYFIPSSHSYGNLRDPEGTVYPHVMEESDLTRFNYFEAKSIRKIGNKYLLIFSGYSGPDYGLESTNSSLRYGYGDSPLGPWKAGGVLIDSRGPVLNRDGSALETVNDWHNTHGGLECVDGQWYCFYHRPPRGYGFARQPMVAPVIIEWDQAPVSEGGKVVISAYDPYAKDQKWTAKASNGDEYTGAQVTSEGFNPYGLPPYDYYSAGIASYLSRTFMLKDSYDIWDNHMPLENIRSDERIGFLHFDFRKMEDQTQFNVWLTPKSDAAFIVNIWLDGPWENDPWKGKKIGRIEIPANAAKETTQFSVDVTAFVKDLTKKHAIFIVGEAAEENLFDLIGLGFSSPSKKLEKPIVPTVKIFVDGKELELPTLPTPSSIENGYSDYGTYEVEVVQSENATKIPYITASTNHPMIAVTITQAQDIFGLATVSFDYNERIKTYKILFNPPSNKGECLEYFIARSHPIFEGEVHQSWNEEIAGFVSGDSLNAVTFTIDVLEAGDYEVLLTHNAAVPTEHLLIFNDETEVIHRYRTGGWLQSTVSESMKFKEGDNLIRIVHHSGEAELRMVVLRKILK